MNDNDFAKLGELFSKSENTLIILSQRPSVDIAAAALALYLSFRNTEKKKQVSVACSEPIRVGLNRLVAVDKITNKVGSKNLVISFDYVEDSIEKVSYHINNGKFNLVIRPKGNFSPLNPEEISYSYTGAASDLVITVGAQRLEDLGRIYEEEKQLFSEQETVNFDIDSRNSLFGKTNFVDFRSSSYCELAGLMIRGLGLPTDADVATNLLAGIEAATKNLAFKTRAETFDIVSWCLKNGGRRGQMVVGQPQGASQFSPRYFNRAQAPNAGYSRKYNFQKPVAYPASSKAQSYKQQTYQRGASLPQQRWQNNQEGNLSHPPSAQFQGQNQRFIPQSDSAALKKDDDQPPSPDWLKPKIYKGGTRV